MTAIRWVGIGLCIVQAGMFSGLNLAFFSISKLRLEVQAAQGNRKAIVVSALREDANLLLSSILWGNVAVNVLLTLLSSSVLAGVAAFLFSTVVLTLLGEIIPQAYFSKHALSAAYYLAPVVKFYKILLYVVAKPTALLLNALLGRESIRYFREAGLREVIRMHMAVDGGDIAEIEGTGALNFLALDDLTVIEEGEAIDPASIIELPFEHARPLFPEMSRQPDSRFLSRINASGRKWAIVVNENGEPRVVVNTDSLIRDALFGGEGFSPYRHCHRPIIITEERTLLEEVLRLLKVHPEHADDDVIDQDIVLVWTAETRRIITGSDILGRLLRGIVATEGFRPD
jgi:metal transporter CNNM